MSSCFKILKSLLKNCRVQERRYKKSAENQGAVSVSTLREKKVNMWNKKGFTEYHIWKDTSATCNKALHEATAGSWSQIYSKWKWEALKAVQRSDKLLRQGQNSPCSLQSLPVGRVCLSGVNISFPELLKNCIINSIRNPLGPIQNQKDLYWSINV